MSKQLEMLFGKSLIAR